MFRYLVFDFRDCLSSSSRTELGRAAELAREVAWRYDSTRPSNDLFPCLCLYVYVLFHWIQDTTRKATTRPSVDKEARERREEKRPRVVSFQRTTEGQDRLRGRSHHVLRMTERPRNRGRGCDEFERIAYERIAASLSLGRRS